MNKIKDRDFMIILMDTEKLCDKIQHLFTIIPPKKLRLEGNLPNLIKAKCKQPTANAILNGKRSNAFPIRSGTRQGYLPSPFVFNTVLEVLTKAIRQEKEMKDI